MKYTLTPAQVRELIDYDPITGVVTWLARTAEYPVFKAWNKRWAGKRVGWIDAKGYWHTSIRDDHYLLHRMIWAHYYGVWPTKQIDHINNDPGDNRISNLREATNGENGCNAKLKCTNKTGVKGVRLVEGRWRGQLWHDGKAYHIGYFRDFDAAVQAMYEARNRIHGAFARHY